MMERIKVVPLKGEHAEEIFLDLQDDRIFSYITEKKYSSLQELKERFETLVKGPKPDRPEKWLNWIIYDRISSTTIGTLQATILLEERTAIVAYIIWPRHWRQGYASEGLAWLLSHLKIQAEADTALAYIDVRNDASQGVVKKTGFSFKETVTTDDESNHIFQKFLHDSHLTISTTF